MVYSEAVAEMIAACANRQMIYDMLAGLYYAPLTEEQIEAMAHTDYRSIEAANDQIAAGFNDISRFLCKRHTGTRQMLAIDYTSSFGGTASYEGKVAVPYASVFLSETGLLNQEPRNDVYFAYRRERLAVKNKSIPADHLSYELEFLGVLSQRAAEALETGDEQRALELLKSSRRFIENNVQSWFSQLKELALKIISTRFYRGVLELTEGYLAFDRETLDEFIADLEMDNG